MKLPALCALAAVAGLWLAAGASRATDRLPATTDLERRQPVNPMLSTPDGQRPSAAVLRAFARFDDDRDGALSEAEWARYAREPEGVPLDPDGDGRISPAEFQETLLRLRYPREVSCNPTMVDVYRGGRLLSAAGEWRYALERYAYQIADTGDSPSGLVGNGRCAAMVNGVGAARRLFEKALTVDPACNEAYLDLAMADAALDREFETALRTGLRRLKMVRAVRLDASTGYWYDLHVQRMVERVASFLKTRARQPRAAAELRRFARVELPVRFPEPGPEAPSLFRAAQLFQTGLFAEAERVVRAVERRDPRDWRVTATRAAMRLGRGLPSEVNGLIDRARVQGAPADLLTCLALGLAAARKDHAAVVGRIAGLQVLKVLPWRCEEAAWQLAYQGNLGDALRVLRPSALLPGRGLVNDLLMGYCNARLGQVDAALEYLPRLATLLSAEAWSLRISAGLAQRLGRVADANRLWEMICWREPWESDAWVSFAETSRLLGQLPVDPFPLLAGMRFSPITSSGWPVLASGWLRYYRDFVLTEFGPTEVANFLTVSWDETLHQLAAELDESGKTVYRLAQEYGWMIQAQLLDLLLLGLTGGSHGLSSQTPGR